MSAAPWERFPAAPHASGFGRRPGDDSHSFPRHHEADPRLLVAVIVVVGDEDIPEAVDGGHVIVAEVVGDQFQVPAVHVASPDRAGAQGCGVACERFALAVAGLEVAHARVADREIEFSVGADRDAMHAVVVVDALKSGEELDRRPVRLVVAILVFQEKDVRRLTQEHLATLAGGIGSHGDADGAHDLPGLVKGDAVVGGAVVVRVAEDHDPVAFGTKGWLPAQLAAVVHRLANPDPAGRVDVECGGIHEQRLGRPKAHFQAGGNGEAGRLLFRWQLVRAGDHQNPCRQ